MLKFTGTPPIFTSDNRSIQVVMHGVRSIFPSCAEYVPTWNIILAEKSPHVVNMLGDLVTTGVTRKGTDNECVEVMDILLSNDADIDDIDAVPEEKKDVRVKKIERKEERRDKEKREEREGEDSEEERREKREKEGR